MTLLLTNKEIKVIVTDEIARQIEFGYEPSYEDVCLACIKAQHDKTVEMVLAKIEEWIDRGKGDWQSLKAKIRGGE